MDFSFSNIIKEVKQLIIRPKEFWVAKKEEDTGASTVLAYLLPFFLVLAVAVFIGEFFRRSDFFFEYPVLKTIREILLFILLYFISVFFVKELMKTFGGEKNVVVARTLVIYSMIPFLLVSIVTGLFQYISVLKVLGLYSFYLFWIGAEILVELPENKKYQYALIVIFVNLLVYSFLGWFLTNIFEFLLLRM